MNYIGKITIIGSVVVCLGAGIYFAPKLFNEKPEENQKNDYSSIYDKIETTTEIKKVQFSTAEEMFEYSEKVSKINGLEEASSFIKEFLNVCSTGKPEAMLTYFDSSTWDYILDNNAFPFYDATGSVNFSATDIQVEESKEENQYIVTYTVIATDAETNEKIAELKRKDTFELYKDFETITIISYSRKTLSEKFD